MKRLLTAAAALGLGCDPAVRPPRPEAATAPAPAALRPLELASALKSARDPAALDRSAAVLRAHLTHPDWTVREEATRALERLGPAAVRYLARLFGDPDPELSWRTRRALERIGWPDEGTLEQAGQEGPGAARLLASVLRERMIQKASPAIQALGRIGGSSARQAVEPLARDLEPHVRYHAARALGRIGDPLAVPVLDELKLDADQGVRFAAAGALLRLGKREAYEGCAALQKALQGREAAQIGLYNLACLAALAGRNEEACGHMARACQQGFRDARGAAADPDLYDLRDDPTWQRLLMVMSRSHAWGD